MAPALLNLASLLLGRPLRFTLRQRTSASLTGVLREMETAATVFTFVTKSEDWGGPVEPREDALLRQEPTRSMPCT